MEGLFVKTSNADTANQLRKSGYKLLAIHCGVWVFENNKDLNVNFASLEEVVVDSKLSI